MIESFLKRRTIRDFLALHNDKQWKKIITYTLEYGIENLKANFNITHLTANDIKEILGKLLLKN